MVRGRFPRRETGDSGAAGATRGPRPAQPRACGSLPPRRRCSSARSGSVRRAVETGPHGTPQPIRGAGAPPGPAGRRRRRMRSRSSRSTSDCPQPTSPARATTTRSAPAPGGRSMRRKLSRRRRRARFLSTAQPARRLTARPRRSKGRPLGAATRRNRRPSRRCPRLKTASNCAPVRRRWRGRRRTRRLPASGGDPLPTLLAATLEHQLPTLRPHPDEEAVGALALAVVRLKRPLHR